MMVEGIVSDAEPLWSVNTGVQTGVCPQGSRGERGCEVLNSRVDQGSPASLTGLDLDLSFEAPVTRVGVSKRVSIIESAVGLLRLWVT